MLIFIRKSYEFCLPKAGTTPSSSGRLSTDAEADDVIVDGDELEESSFGPSQYTESDVVIKGSQHKKREKEGQSQVDTVNSSGDVIVKSESAGQQCDSIVSTSDAEPSSRAHMIEELRNRIRQLEAEGTGETITPTENEDYKCLICLVRINFLQSTLIIHCFVLYRSIIRNQ